MCSVFQAWITARCWSRWSEATGCHVHKTAPSQCTSWCCSAGRRMLKNGPLLSTCKPSWRITSQPRSHSTSPGTISKDLRSQCCDKNSAALPAGTLFYGCVQLPLLKPSILTSTTNPLKLKPPSPPCLLSPPVSKLFRCYDQGGWGGMDGVQGGRDNAMK